ncbi:SRPBCC family protein [Porphyromonas circumdentaria]|uniref:Polyketide cyclase / dehydrase and lipid transport n=1 Tax=Porphyromonas circumdentaria TaxID=29524 RepID=A0A1T4L3K4_9PORP|nr:SRPBCC family protein [Porphyromonas circumdentaria]MBB6275215.1 molybdopterin-guanine dinucleotide biosynthesis protein A [Porphyromonas circumdentaria]SJZ49299.1 Polyketide cyclase / dehydrase and lipid transport [Porphyromonas circumdentaria]
MKVSSTPREIKAPIALVFAKVSNFENLRPLAEKGAVGGVSIVVQNRDTCFLETSIVGNIELTIVQREEPTLVSVSPKGAPVNGSLSLILTPLSEETTSLTLTLEADVPIFAKAMVAKPMSEGVEKVAELLSSISFN